MKIRIYDFLGWVIYDQSFGVAKLPNWEVDFSTYDSFSTDDSAWVGKIFKRIEKWKSLAEILKIYFMTKKPKREKKKEKKEGMNYKKQKYQMIIPQIKEKLTGFW